MVRAAEGAPLPVDRPRPELSRGRGYGKGPRRGRLRRPLPARGVGRHRPRRPRIGQVRPGRQARPRRRPGEPLRRRPLRPLGDRGQRGLDGLRPDRNGRRAQRARADRGGEVARPALRRPERPLAGPRRSRPLRRARATAPPSSASAPSRREQGKAAGIMLRSPDEIPALAAQGYHVFTTSDRSLFTQSARRLAHGADEEVAMRYRYEDYPVDLLRQLLTMQELVKLFLQLVLQAGGDVEEALRWMQYLQDRGMIDPGIDLDEFRKALQESEIVEDRGGQLALSAAGERRIRRSALEEIFTSLTRAGSGLPRGAARGRRGRAPARDARLRVRRQPQRDRRDPLDRQRRAPRRGGHRPAAGGLRGPRGRAPDAPAPRCSRSTSPTR